MVRAVVVALELLAVLLVAACAGLLATGWVAGAAGLVATGAGLGAAGVVVALGAWRAEKLTGGPHDAAVRSSAQGR